MQWALKTRQQIVVFGLLALVMVAITALILTRDSSSQAARARPRRAPLVDEQPMQTARSMATLASDREEQRYAQQALQLADHAVDLAFADALGLTQVDILGFSLGGMVAQQIALERPSLVRKMLLVGTAPEGGEDIMHMEKPELKKITDDPNLPGLQRLVKLFFTPSPSSQAAGEAFIARLAQRKQDREPLSGPNVAKAQIAAFRAWEAFTGERFAKLHKIKQPCLVANGVFDAMIPVRNSYMLSEHLPNAMLLTYPNAGHGSLFQFHESFVRQASMFLESDKIWPA